MDVPFFGGCACGAVRYECSAAPVAMVNCHCRDCQRAGGTGFSPTVVVPADSFRLLRGEPKRATRSQPTADTLLTEPFAANVERLSLRRPPRAKTSSASRQAALMTRVGSSRRLKCGLQAHSRGIIWVPTCHTLRTVGSALRMPNKRPAADAAPVAVPSDFESVRLGPCR
jgi:hypothetical protein